MNRTSLLAALALGTMASSAMAGGFGFNFHTPVRQRDSWTEEQNAKRLAAAEAKRARRAAKAKQ